MNRLELIQNKVNQLLEKNEDAESRHEGYNHLFGVSQYCIILAMKRGLNLELCAIAGLLHDIYTYTIGYSKTHAILGAVVADELLTEFQEFTNEEISIITTAISNHSNKKEIHDEYSELLKDADTLQNSLYNPWLNIKHKRRLKLILKELGVKTKLKYLLDPDLENIEEELSTESLIT